MAEPVSALQATTHPMQRRRALDRAWLAFIEDGVEPDGLSPEIARSWRRAREVFGVDPTLLRAQRVLQAEALADRRRRDQAWRLARPVLERAAARLGSAQHVLAWFDPSGWMLSIQGHQRVVEGVAEINFSPGACWSEEAAGTNGPGTALREEKPVEVFASEHFVEAWQCWNCAGAPVFRPNGGPLVGLVDLTGPWDVHQPQALAIASAIARAVEERLAVAASVRDEVIRFAFQGARGSGDALVAVDGDGRILAANGSATSRIGLESGRLPPDLRRQVETVVLGEGCDELELRWRDLRVVAQPVLHDGVPVGAVVRGLTPAAPFQRPARAGAAAPTARPAALARRGFEAIIYESDAMRQAVELARTAARTALPVVLSGESGTGKELFAQAIHAAGPRVGGPLVAVNCGSIPAALVEAELFGYEAGTFTGGRREGNAGKFEEADGGTLFLDEVSELSPQGQTALLRVLQEREVVRLGGSAPRRVDARIVAASNCDLRAEVAAGRFRQDLYYRLDVLSIRIPPLRQRSEDVPLLAQAFLETAEAEVGRAGLAFGDEAVAALQACTWPGNVRQLRNVVLRAAATSPEALIRALDLSPEVLAAPLAPIRPAAVAPRSLDAAEAIERAELLALLEATRWNVAEASKALGVSRMTVYRRMDRLGVGRPDA
jgi:transcriptional regulator of acetoin/glycerol metabolism